MKQGFNLVHKADLTNILAGLLIANRAITQTNPDYQAGFAAAIMALAAAIGKQNELQAEIGGLNGLAR